jgi:hypothetical protein
MLLTSAAGFVVDKVDQKKYIIGTATTLIGLNFMSLGPYQDRLGFSTLTKEILLGVTFGGMGLICPFIIVPIIPVRKPPFFSLKLWTKLWTKQPFYQDRLGANIVSIGNVEGKGGFCRICMRATPMR